MPPMQRKLAQEAGGPSPDRYEPQGDPPPTRGQFYRQLACEVAGGLAIPGAAIGAYASQHFDISLLQGIASGTALGAATGLFCGLTMAYLVAPYARLSE